MTNNTKKLFVGNLPYSVTNWQELKDDLSRDVGTVLRVNIIHDRETGKSKGFAFIVVPEDQAELFLSGPAIEYRGRELKVREAIERTAPANAK